jgi:hypothetical protein
VHSNTLLIVKVVANVTSLKTIKVDDVKWRAKPNLHNDRIPNLSAYAGACWCFRTSLLNVRARPCKHTCVMGRASACTAHGALDLLLATCIIHKQLALSRASSSSFMLSLTARINEDSRRHPYLVGIRACLL